MDSATQEIKITNNWILELKKREEIKLLPTPFPHPLLLLSVFPSSVVNGPGAVTHNLCPWLDRCRFSRERQLWRQAEGGEGWMGRGAGAKRGGVMSGTCT